MIEFGVFWRCDSIGVVLVLEFGVTLERFIS